VMVSRLVGSKLLWAEKVSSTEGWNV